MQPIPSSVGETLPGRQVYSFVSSRFSFKQNIMCPFKGDSFHQYPRARVLAFSRLLENMRSQVKCSNPSTAESR